MATRNKRGGDDKPKTVPDESNSSKPSCWDWCNCGKQSSSTTEDQVGKGKQAAGTEKTKPDGKQNGYASQDYTNVTGGQYAGANATVKNKGNYGQTSDQLYQKLENSNGSPVVGDKKMGSKLPLTLGSSDQDATTKSGRSLKPEESLQNKKENSYGSSTGKNNGSPGVGDKKMDKLLETLVRSDQDATTKTGRSLKPGESLQNKQEHSYGISTEKFNGCPGVCDRKMGSTQPETLGISAQDAKTKTGSSLKPGESLQNKQEHNYGISTDKFKGSPGVGDRKMGSTQPETLGGSAQDAKTKSGSSLKPGESLQNKQEHSYGISTEKFNGSPIVDDRKMSFTQPETLGSSAQVAKTTTSSSLKPGQQLQYKQGNSIPEQLLHKSSPKGDFRQEDINKNAKDPNPQKVTNIAFSHSSEEQRKGSPNPENNIEPQTKKFNGDSEQARLSPRNEKQKDMVKQPSFKNKDNIYVDTSSPNTSKSRVGYTSAEQQKGAPKQENNSANPTNTRPRSPMITNLYNDGINKDDKNKGPNYIEAARSSTGLASKEQPKVTQKQDSSYGNPRSTDPIKNTVSGSTQEANIPSSNRQKGIREEKDMKTKDKFGFSNSFVQRD